LWQSATTPGSDYQRYSRANCRIEFLLRKMSANQKLLAAWKLCLSFRKRDWQRADYPVIIREQKLERDSDRSSSRGVQQRYLARIVNWWVMTGGGDTPGQAMAELVDGFGRIKDTRQRDGKAMPRPGTEARIEFAPSNRVHAHRELLSSAYSVSPGPLSPINPVCGIFTLMRPTMF
jgi:hypothetical protein